MRSDGKTARLTLGEGGTPLVRSRRIGPELGLDHLYFKLEAVNPTGSYKDRFAAAGIQALVQSGRRGCLCTSSGNTGAALAAYSAAAGIPCVILAVEGAAPAKLAHMRAYGATVVEIEGFGRDPDITRRVFDDAVAGAGRIGFGIEISAYRYSPIGMAGVEQISREVHQQLPECEAVYVPAGGGGLALAVARGVVAAWVREKGAMPAVHVVQPKGNNTIAGPLRAGSDHAQPCAGETTISGLQVPSVIDGDATVDACRRTGGTGFLIDDAAAYECQERLSTEEGIYAEGAGAVALAGLMQALAERSVRSDCVVTCLVTGTGFKDMDRRTAARPPVMPERLVASDVADWLDGIGRRYT